MVGSYIHSFNSLFDGGQSHSNQWYPNWPYQVWLSEQVHWQDSKENMIDDFELVLALKIHFGFRQQLFPVWKSRTVVKRNTDRIWTTKFESLHSKLTMFLRSSKLVIQVSSCNWRKTRSPPPLPVQPQIIQRFLFKYSHWNTGHTSAKIKLWKSFFQSYNRWTEMKLFTKLSREAFPVSF